MSMVQGWQGLGGAIGKLAEMTFETTKGFIQSFEITI